MSVIAIKALIVFFALTYGVTPVLALRICEPELDFDVAAIGDGKAGVGMVFWGMIGFSTSLSGYLAAIQRSNMR